jgi:hypothetical protein
MDGRLTNNIVGFNVPKRSDIESLVWQARSWLTIEHSFINGETPEASKQRRDWARRNYVQA